jgi:hypothetical protein
MGKELSNEMDAWRAAEVHTRATKIRQHSGPAIVVCFRKTQVNTSRLHRLLQITVVRAIR